ncbi:MAG: hypothetical protein LBR14_01905 [Clostridiales Family XIII bacterium]|nr:hypothetical protein [Clostridiales Family XIII bacterium]
MILFILYAGIAMGIKLSDFERLEKVGAAPISFGALQALFPEYASPAVKISEMCKQEMLIRLKKGLYYVAPRISRVSASVLSTANHLYGPSYVSFHTALEYYGLIPEGVRLIMSATPRRSKHYETPIANYAYHTIPEIYYPIGITTIEDTNGQHVLFATPEKAICDLLQLENNLRIRSADSMWSYLTDFMRMDEDILRTLDSQLIAECAAVGKKKEMLLFLKKAVENAQ